MMRKTIALTSIALAAFGALALVLVTSAQAQQLPKARNGTLFCGGSYNFEGNDLSKPVNMVTWNLRNYNGNRTILIDRIRLYDATGAVLFDSDTDGLPADRRDILGGPDNNQLGPYQTVQFRSDDLVDGTFPFVPGSRRPIQFVVDWSADRRAIVLDGSQIRRVFDASFNELSRHQYDCRRR
ncbi:MAG: hypothetical protein OEM93_17310 [Rhodospirillales bacterium]|nr:hypothetical protein [Rhodospirillales bacterium]MDH3917322.1 hypothetical protein [Rhodospirillales bacterium]MDH3968500.1 hypothetical protein [Rhodospirillales bacterium]